jgi:hypothetical protein
MGVFRYRVSAIEDGDVKTREYAVNWDSEIEAKEQMHRYLMDEGIEYLAIKLSPKRHIGAALANLGFGEVRLVTV